MGRSESRQRRYLHPADRLGKRGSTHRSLRAGLQPRLVARRPMDRISPGGGTGPKRADIDAATRRPEQRLAEVHIPNQIYPNYLSWFPDSSALVVVHAAPQQTTAGLFVVSVQTRELRALTRPTGSSYHQCPAVSPDGRTVAFKNGSALSLLALRPDLTPAAEPRRLVDAPSSLQPTWTPDGKEIIYVQSFRLWRIDVTGEHPPRPLPFGGEGAIMPVISRPVAGKGSRLIYVRRTADQNLWRVDLPALGTPARSAPILFPSSTTRTDYNAQFSPDGKRLAFQSDRSGQMEIWVSDADGANAQPLTAMGSHQHRHAPLVARRTDDCVRFQCRGQLRDLRRVRGRREADTADI